ncbi:MAG: VWA domain-containing protein [Verrucomicrobia bacterium]|nr:VWA domain-containing protein [Verrucomicrobiota bacterium]
MYKWLFFLFFALGSPLLYVYLASYKEKQLYKLFSKENVNSIAQRSWLSFTTKALCLSVAGCLISLYLIGMGREHGEESAPAPNSSLDEIAFFLDVSHSMDCTDTPVGASRLNLAKEIIGSLVEGLGGLNISLTAFSGTPVTIVPATEDYLYFRILLAPLRGDELPEPGTDLTKVADLVQKEYVKSDVAKSVQVILLTDGEDTTFLGMGAAERTQAEATLIDLIAKSKSDMLHLDVIALGTEKGAVVPGVTFNGAPVISSMRPKILEKIAIAGGGHLYLAENSSVNSIVDNILAQIAIRQFKGAATVVEPIESRPPYFPIVGAVLLILASLVIPERGQSKGQLIYG